MEITTNKIKEVLDTLPIDYYCGRHIEVALTDEADTSYYEIRKDKITFSAKNVKAIVNSAFAKGTVNEFNFENIVRGILYHELSHAILTPKYDFDCNFATNVVEDERIETVLKDYYLDVDFKKNVILLNNYQGEPPKSCQEAFYQLVRYRVGEKKWLEELDSILKDFATLTRADEGYHYSRRIEKFYRDFIKEQEKNGLPNNKNEENSQSYLSIDNGEEESEEGGKNGESGDGGEEVGGRKVLTQDGGEEEIKAKALEVIEKAKEAQNASKVCSTNSLKSFQKSLSGYCNKKMIDELEMIFMSYNNRQTNNGSATQSYSGVFNPRNVARNDYRFFDRKAIKGTTKGFSKFHLNLLVDKSGSFENNVQITNEFLYALQEIEKKIPTFSFDVILCGSGSEICNKNERFTRSSDSSYFESDLERQLKEIYKPDAINYTIALFDGYFASGEYSKCLNNSRTSIICDSECERLANNFWKESKVYLTDDYVKVFFEKIKEILTFAFN